ncbi:unnamed protein product, partial [Meganyctiphanes norvegica]
MEMKLASERPMGRTMVPTQGGTKPRLVTPGEVISEDTSFMRNPSTFDMTLILATAVGDLFLRLNCYISIDPVALSFVVQLTVAHGLEVRPQCWRAEVISHLRNFISKTKNRRKGLEDERCMRGLLQEGDLVCVEVQKITDDGLLRLAARSSKFGKLMKHEVKVIHKILIVVNRGHIQYRVCGGKLIIGIVAYVFLLKLRTPEQRERMFLWESINKKVQLDIRKTIGRLYNCIRLLSHHSIMISPTSVMAAYDQSVESDLEIKDLLRPDVMQDIAMATVQVTIS